jgi:cation diffusion facilitator CzcD-associated flavoprotein CzcO
VIGNGASGIQIVPNIQRTAAHVDHYARNKTWVAATWLPDDIRTLEPQRYTEEQLKSFEDPQKYLEYRKELEGKYWRGFHGILRGSEENGVVRQTSIDRINKILAKKPELIENLIPDFSPSCRRLTPGPGYLESLAEDNVAYIQTPIKEFTETGIVTVDGKHREVDAVFCATGANVDFIPSFPIIAHGVNLRDAWSPGGKWGHPYTYLGLASPGFPNLLWTLGAHAAGVTGTVPQALEVQLTYYAKLLRKVSSQGIKSVTPSTAATEDFIAYANRFFASTVFTENCRSWANGGKAGGFIHGHWPGSAAHLTIIRKEPRWEDWDFAYASEEGGRFGYFGDGYTEKELDPESDLVDYLKLPDQIDLRSLHENWWE